MPDAAHEIAYEDSPRLRRKVGLPGLRPMRQGLLSLRLVRVLVHFYLLIADLSVMKGWSSSLRKVNP